MKVCFLRLIVWYGENIFANRSKAIQQAVEEKIQRYDEAGLQGCAKLDPKIEQSDG